MIVAKLAALSVLAVYPHDHPDIASSECLAQHYLGTYGSQSVFVPPESCIDVSTLTQDAPVVDIHPDIQLVWLEQAALEQHLLINAPTFSAESIQGHLSALPNAIHESPVTRDQQAFSHHAAASVLHTTATSALIALDAQHALHLSLVLPPTWRIYVLPTQPVPLFPVPEPAVARVRDILASLKFNPDVAKAVSNISLAQIRNDIRFLTGEDGVSGIVSRHSFSAGARTAAEWLKLRFEETGATCELRSFLLGFAPNVICRYPATENTTATVLVSAHYDSRGSFGSTRAPGGDDDGSGTTGLLSIARTIKRTGLTFRSNVELVAFAGEEQGLFGSNHYAKELREQNKNLTLMVQADMTAYHEPGEPPQLGLPERIGTPEVTDLVAKLAALYSPELVVGFTAACCSDHQSFHAQGFPATQVFERAGPIIDPMYHNSGDLSERIGYDFEQLRSIAKVQFATVLHTAGFDLP
ncbi:hypothetical protein BC834DRAFT_867216 [Gloeopeniophorella convolvens]|nr:hypothetical protein BC834DRAFT_867216 [Gloeopeniophorella convolvens]